MGGRFFQAFQHFQEASVRQPGLEQADGNDGVNDVGHPGAQPGRQVPGGCQGGEEFIQEQHGRRQEQSNAYAGHRGAPLERDGGGNGDERQDDAGKHADILTGKDNVDLRAC